MLKIRKSYWTRVLSFYLVLSILFQIVSPTAAFALTGGPSQPEVESFTPVATSDMVDLHSGNFNYNIPLMDVGGYPLNISYNSGITMDQEASWVGLGWNLNNGVMTRSMRGLPDDFDGDEVQKEFFYKPNRTFGAGFGLGFEIYGVDTKAIGLSVGASINATYNTYTGFGLETAADVSLSAGNKFKGGKVEGLGLGLNLKSGSSGLSVDPSISYSRKISGDANGSTSAKLSLGLDYSSRGGLKALTLGYSISQNPKETKKINKRTVTNSSSLNGGSSISFGYQTYAPYSEFPMQNLAFSAKVKWGAMVFGFDGSYDISGYYAQQKLSYTSESVPAYGYLNAHHGEALNDVLMDFNREKDGAVTKFTPNLGVTNFTYDIYSAAGQGISGMYRPFRSDLGYVFNKEVSSSPDLSFDAGLELGDGELVKAGVDIAFNEVDNFAGKWVDDNAALSKLKFRGTAYPLYEPYYFKQAGEKSVDADPNLFNSIGGEDPVEIKLQSASKFHVYADEWLKYENGNTIHLPSTNYRQNRQRRNQDMSLVKYQDYQNESVNPSLYNSISTNAKGNHISEISILRPDGMRYIYGLPAYNFTNKEVSFNINKGGQNPDCTTGLIGYSSTGSNPDNSVNNANDNDNFFSSTTIPAYAHSFMLTSVVSPDFIDVDGVPGPSEGDFGTYTSFSYQKVNNYKWRTPYDQNKASFNEGLKTLKSDNRASYVYGEKELWYVTKIETKNYIAIFEIGDRKDGYEVADENGGAGTTTMKYLKKISLYTQPEYKKYLSNSSYTPIPIKEVHFVYDYSLCTNIPNNKGNQTFDPASELSNDGGKLTLKKVYFTYANSYKAKLSPYEFSYGGYNQTSGTYNYNPQYNQKSYSRWGSYKENSCNIDSLDNGVFPFVPQDSALVNRYSKSWNMDIVKLPSGGKINVKYESDDYAYVQNKEAMQMFKITGMSLHTPNDPSYQPTGNIPDEFLGHGNTSTTNIDDKVVLYFKKDPHIPTSEYVSGITDLYFKALVNVNNVGYDYVTGFGQIWSYGEHPGNPSYGYIQLKQVDLGDNTSSLNVNPITKTAIQLGRIYTPTISYGFGHEPSPNVKFLDVIQQIVDATFIKNIFEAFDGPNGTLFTYGYGQKMYPYKSFIRLNCASKRKLGGDLRVKAITISDEWQGMESTASTFSYGQEYDYTTQENGKTISSGVASYEPQVGAEENPFKLPVYEDVKHLWAPDDHFYQLEPYGESFFPSPSIGYAKVSVKNLKRKGVKKHATGIVVNEFFTTYDYPTKATRTTLKPPTSGDPGNLIEHKSNAIGNIFKFNVRHFMTASQGFSIVLNDMDGKQKAQWVYAEGNTEPISGVEYFYKDNGYITSDGKRIRGNGLDNNVSTINKKGEINTNMVGVDYDFVTDFQEQSTEMSNIAAQINIYGEEVVVPIIIPPIWVTSQHERTQFRSATVCKVIQKYGLLDETVAHDLGSIVKTKNIAYDQETGEVLLTQVQNEFNDPIFNFNYPSHWSYEGMGQSYKNMGLNISISSLSSIANAQTLFYPGDELIVNGSQRAWVTSVNSGSITLIDATGNSISSASSLKIVRSGRRNMQAISVGTISSMVNPIDKNGDNITDPKIQNIDESYKIIQSNAVIFNNKWRTFCECGVKNNTTYNPYRIGILGNYRQIATYLYLTDRLQTKLNTNTNIRKDGMFNEFTPFWQPNNGDDWQYPTNLGLGSKWRFTTAVTEFSPYGVELENVDALGRFSSATYGYNNSLPTAVASNSGYVQVGVDAFEDYNFGTCLDDHFSFKKDPLKVIDGSISHTGKNSVKVSGGNSVKMTKDINNCLPPNIMPGPAGAYNTKR